MPNAARLGPGAAGGSACGAGSAGGGGGSWGLGVPPKFTAQREFALTQNLDGSECPFVSAMLIHGVLEERCV